MVDDLDGDAPRLGFLKRAGGVAVQGGPSFLVDFGLEGGLERLIRVVRAKEVGVADEEAFFVVVGVDEPAGYALGAVAADFAGVGVEDVDAVDLDADLAGFAVCAGVEDGDVGLAEDDEEVALAGVLEVAGHVQAGVHAGFQHGDAAEFAELGGHGIVVEDVVA